MSKNVLEMEKALLGKKVDWEDEAGGTRRFSGEERINLEKIDELIRKDYIDLDRSQNLGPTVQELAEIGDEVNEELPNEVEIEYGGYMKSPERGRNITITKVVVDASNSDKDIPASVIATLREIPADEKELSTDYLKLWWD